MAQKQKGVAGAVIKATFSFSVSVNGSILAGTMAILSIRALRSALGGFVNLYVYDLLYLYLILYWYSPSPFWRSVCQDGHRFVWYSNSRVPTTAATEMQILLSRPYTLRMYALGYDRRPFW